MGADAAPIPPGRRVGMYHFGLNVGETRRRPARHGSATVQEAGATVVGASDHTVTHSLYIEDPDGNEIELYVDVPGVDWQADPALVGARRSGPSGSEPSAAAVDRRGPITMEDRCAPTTSATRCRGTSAACVAVASSWCRPTPCTGWPPARRRRSGASVYRAKGRPEGMHLPVLAASLDQVRGAGCGLRRGGDELAGAVVARPLTLAFGFEPASTRPAWLDGRDEVAVRIPDHDFLLALMAQTGVLVVTSANPHGAPTPRTAGEVAARAWARTSTW